MIPENQTQLKVKVTEFLLKNDFLLKTALRNKFLDYSQIK